MKSEKRVWFGWFPKLTVFLSAGALLATVPVWIKGSQPGEPVRPYGNDQRLRDLNKALIQYTEDHGGNLPDLSNDGAIRSCLGPYVPTEKAFVETEASLPFLANAHLSRLPPDKNGRVSRAGRLASTITFYEPSFHFDPAQTQDPPKRQVIRLSGIRQSFTRREWQTALAVPGIWGGQ